MPWQGQPPMPGGAQTVIMGAPRPEPSFAWLVIVSGVRNNPNVGQPLPIKSAGTTTLGRVPGNDIIVADPACSSQHAKIRCESGEDGKHVFVMYDLASSNGLYIGSKDNYKDEANRKYRQVLHDGDYILIGETTLVFKQV
jgi:pSer/pThr/pTyr-binding forkhead associated (FHA) protein